MFFLLLCLEHRTAKQTIPSMTKCWVYLHYPASTSDYITLH